MQVWCMAHPDAYVLYLHMKGVTHGNDKITNAWRNCMVNVVIGHWSDCVRALNAGYDMAGAHWVDETCAVAPVPCYWAGNFFWATAKFINTLPLIAPTAVEDLNRFDAEVLVARGPVKAKVRDLGRHWPGIKCLTTMSERPATP
jgi:hypothetical protein